MSYFDMFTVIYCRPEDIVNADKLFNYTEMSFLSLTSALLSDEMRTERCMKATIQSMDKSLSEGSIRQNTTLKEKFCRRRCHAVVVYLEYAKFAFLQWEPI